MEKILKNLGMNAHEFATHYGIPYITVYQWVTGKRTPPSYVIKLLNEKIERDSKGEQLRIEDNDYLCIEYRRTDNSIKYRAFLENTEESKEWFNKRQNDWIKDDEQRIQRLYKLILLKESYKNDN